MSRRAFGVVSLLGLAALLALAIGAACLISSDPARVLSLVAVVAGAGAIVSRAPAE